MCLCVCVCLLSLGQCSAPITDLISWSGRTASLPDHRICPQTWFLPCGWTSRPRRTDGRTDRWTIMSSQHFTVRDTDQRRKGSVFPHLFVHTPWSRDQILIIISLVSFNLSIFIILLQHHSLKGNKDFQHANVRVWDKTGHLNLWGGTDYLMSDWAGLLEMKAALSICHVWLQETDLQVS